MNKEIQKKIEDEAETRYPVKTHNNPVNSPYVFAQKTFIHGVQFGNSLAEAEIERLRGIIAGLVMTVWATDPFRNKRTREEYLHDFKTDNKL